MEMNPFKPLVQFCEDLYEKKITTRFSINKISLKLSLAKLNS